MRENTQHRTLALMKSVFSWSHSLNFEYIKFRDKDFISIQIYLILLHLASLHFADNVFFTSWRFVATLHQTSLLVPFFPTAFGQSIFVSHFGDSTIFQTFPLLLYLLWWSVVSGPWCCYWDCFGHREPCSCKTENLI